MEFSLASNRGQIAAKLRDLKHRGPPTRISFSWLVREDHGNNQLARKLIVSTPAQSAHLPAAPTYFRG